MMEGFKDFWRGGELLSKVYEEGKREREMQQMPIRKKILLL